MKLHQLLYKYSHISWALADQAMVSGVNFLTGILLARFLGVEEFGRFTLIWMVPLFINSIQMAMISSPMMSIGPKQKQEDLSFYFGAVVVQQFAFALFSFLLVFVGVKLSVLFYPEWGIQDLAVPLAITVFFFKSQDFLRRYFFARDKQAAAFVNDAVSYLGQIFLLGYFFLTASITTYDVLWIIAITSGIAVFCGVLKVGVLSWSYSVFVSIVQRHWHFSKWLIVSSLLQWTSGNWFIVMAGSLLGASAVGILKAAQNIMGVSHILFQGLENIVPIQASKHYHNSGVTGLIRYLKKVAWFGGMATAGIALLAGMFPEFWFGLVYGGEYQGYGFVLQWQALIYVIMFFALPVRIGLRTMEKTFPILLAYVVITLWAFISAAFLINTFKLLGVMIGILVGSIIMLLVVVIIFIFYTKNMLKNDRFLEEQK
jgi:O-antigen/teichoic acid export membrane protein